MPAFTFSPEIAAWAYWSNSSLFNWNIQMGSGTLARIKWLMKTSLSFTDKVNVWALIFYQYFLFVSWEIFGQILYASYCCLVNFLSSYETEPTLDLNQDNCDDWISNPFFLTAPLILKSNIKHLTSHLHRNIF